MNQAAHWYDSIPLVLVLALIGMGTAFGVYKATVGYLAERSKKMDDNFASLQGELADMNRAITELRTVMTGMTGRDGILGDLSQTRKQVQEIEVEVARIQTHLSLDDR